MIELDKEKVVFCCPTVKRPYRQWLDSMEASIPILDAAGVDHQIVFEVGSPYISCARATMLRKALDAKATIIVFLDHDLSWQPDALLRLIRAPGEVVGCTYRFKLNDKEEYMGTILTGPQGTPLVREDGCIEADRLPAGFLKVTHKAVDTFMKAYPELCYGARFHWYVDLFNHGAHEGLWWGEDYSFCRRWISAGGKVWLLPDVDIAHHDPDKSYPGNFHKFMMRQPGGLLEKEAA